MGLVGRSSWAFFKTVPTIHRRHSEPRTESMCLHYNMYNTCSRNLQKSPEPVWQVCLGARWLCRRGQRPICKRAEKPWKNMWNLFVTEVNPCFSWVNVYLFTSSAATNVKVQHQVCRKGSNRNESAWTASFQPFPVRSPCLEKMRGDDPIPQLTTASKEDSNLIPAPTAFVIMLWWVFDIQC